MELDSQYWDSAAKKISGIDKVVLVQKRDTYLRCIREYIPNVGGKLILKTDLYDEITKDSSFFSKLAMPDNKLVGMDISKSVIDLVKRDFLLLSANVLRLPFKDNCFDVIISPSTLDHFKNISEIEDALAEIKRVLKKGGEFVLIMDNKANVFYYLLKVISLLKIIPFYLGKTYTVLEAKNSLERIGFTVEASTAIIHNPRVVSSAIILGMRKLFKASDAMVARFIAIFEKLEKRKTKYLTGCFIVLKAIKK